MADNEPVDFTPLINQLQQSTQAIANLTAAIKAFFPQQGGTSATATAGAATLPANPVGFINVTLTTGTNVKIPYYNP